MKFSLQDIQGFNYGLFIIKDRVNTAIIDESNVDYCASVSFKLCYINNKKVRKYGICNFLTDGWFIPIADTKEELLEYLNKNPHGDHYRFLYLTEVEFMLNNRKNKNQLFAEFHRDSYKKQQDNS